MQYLKTFGLVAAATVVILTITGFGTASATVLCTSTATPCPANGKVQVGANMAASLTNTAIFETTTGETLGTCTGSSFTGHITNAGGATETVAGPVTGLTWTGCTNSTFTTNLGSFEIHHISGTDNGTFTSFLTTIKVTFLGVTCGYDTTNGVDLGTRKGGTDPVLAISAVLPKEVGSFVCPSDIRWTAEYTFTEPASFYVEPS
ncbi:MAG: hypothetical protein ACTHK3_06960 [Solirubrobacterales bacterium]